MFSSKYFDFEKLHESRHNVRAWIGLMPRYIPQIDLLHDGDVGNGHAVTFYDIVRAGPNRIAFMGQPLQLNADASYTRGGALATGHEWRIYDATPSADPLVGINHYEIGSDVLVWGPESGAEVLWTPAPETSIYNVHRIECRTDNRASDGSTDARRWVRLFGGEGDTNLKEVLEMRGSGSIDAGGYSVEITIKAQGGIENLNDWSTVVLMMRTYYGEEEYTMDSQGPDRAPEIQFSGFIAENSIVFDRQSETLTFTLRTPDYALSRMAMRGYPKTVEATVGDPPVTITVPADYPLFFGNPNKPVELPGGTTFDVVSYIRQSDLTLPVHEIDGMTFSDPMYHVLQRHTNYASWWDIELWQETDEAAFPFAFQITNVWDQIREFQEKRLAVAYCDRKGVLFIIPDVLFQSDVWFGTYDPSNQLTFHDGNLKEVAVKRQPFRVSQVKLTGMNDANFPFFARWPDIPNVTGDIVTRTAMMAPNQETMDSWAYRMYTMYNRHEIVTLTPSGVNRAVELSDLVRLTIIDHTGFYSF